MKRIHSLFTILALAVLAAVAVGCSTTKQTESLLSSAGFKKVAVVTPEQQAHFSQLATGSITQVQRDGKAYFVFPDTAHKVLYVGQSAQYQRYQQLVRENQQIEAGLNAEAQNPNPTFNNWETWGEWGVAPGAVGHPN